ncbi:XrtA/PEP-CTERM system amidotransferase [Duganella violaceipulchra]|uniref:asparagine synthase (glutamine-hydrolyzing) n=1 Tax=Duganella violaceipulchra TaxID=2849652 RepID=A0AA41HBJ9_9BURK|nr:XrtA/PEP-CTERM system amidotransferase [Duganella violaceicalia]MBV6321857.1 amidotransferase 1, exosortase A system-associated [Duganella violaceicalia]MCP2007149.1 asparagine synthase (glutamine-hydrolyzing) [Duganella violaceicalia]
MCAIAGIYDLYRHADIDAGLLHAMTERQRHRGPDQGGTHLEPGIGLGHRRLAIIDLGGGQQPLFNEDHSVAVVYNGEIYNFQPLMRELQLFGHTFRTHCDTEVIVHAWEQWGERCVERFRGMFAFALWDRRQQTLFLARDRLGVKPLHYALLDNGQLLFASEIKALLLHDGLRRQLDPLAVEDYFAYGYIPEPRTIFRQVRKLAPGHTLLLRKGQPLPAPRRYWDIPFEVQPALGEAQAADELLARLREAVRIRLVAEVPLGAFLSGGVDSSAVVALMAQASAEPVNTCSISFGDPKFDETSYAQMIAERYGTRHHVQRVEQDDLSLVDRLAGLYDEPYADSSALPTYRVCELARQRVTVALSGDGGDENLAGYRRYRWHLHEERWRTMLPLGLRRPLFGTLGRLYPKADWAPRPLRAKTTFESLARDSVAAYFHSVSIMDDKMRQALFSPALKRDLAGYHAQEVLYRHARDCPAEDALSRIQYLDLKTYLPGDILTKVDRASMAHGLEVRVPLLDHRLVEWMSSLPPELKLRGGIGKYLFKRGLERHLPKELLYRNKMGFSVPLAAWFRGPLRAHLERSLRSPVLADCGLFNLKQVQTLLAQHLSGRSDHSAPLWSLLMFESFLRQLPAAAPRNLVRQAA